MSKTIQNYLPKNPDKVLMVQGRVDRELVKDVKKIMKDRNLSWSDVLTALFKQLLDSQKETKL